MHEVTHKKTVDGKKLYVIDGLLSEEECKSLYSAFESSAFKFNESARPDTQLFRHWALNLSSDQMQNLPFFTRLMNALQELTGNDYNCYRCYCNSSTYGDMLFTHTDCQPGSKEMTVLVYVCPKWDIEWGGETLFYNQHEDCEFGCSPKPGRVVFFDGSIRHAGSPPNRICYSPRYTLAFKLEQLA